MFLNIITHLKFILLTKVKWFHKSNCF